MADDRLCWYCKDEYASGASKQEASIFCMKKRKIFTGETVVSPQLCELRNMITVSYLVVKSAEFRMESRGLHFNTDYPYKSKQVQNIVL
jgi:aspartate oxidase